MDILNLLLNSGLSNNAIDAVAQKSGLDANSVQAVIEKIAPVFMQNANANLKSDADSSGFLDMIAHSNLSNIANNAQNIDIAQGNDLLGIFTGSKENSRALADNVGSQLGIDASSIKALLPMIAPMIAGLFNKQVGASNFASGDTNSISSMLTNFIDQNNDGNIVDDIFRIAGNFFGKK